MSTETVTSTPAKNGPTSRKKLRRLGKKKRVLKLRNEPEFAKAYFEGRSKRSNDKKVAYRKRRAKK